MPYMREDISSKLLSIENTPIEDFYIELNLRRERNVYFVALILQIGILLIVTWMRI